MPKPVIIRNPTWGSRGRIIRVTGWHEDLAFVIRDLEHGGVAYLSIEAYYKYGWEPEDA